MQRDLVGITQALRRAGEISFTSVLSVGAPDGNSWVPKNDFPGHFLIEEFDRYSEKSIGIIWSISRGYSEVVDVYTAGASGYRCDTLAEGQRWIAESLLKWSGPIVTAGLMTYEDMRRIMVEFEEVVRKRGYSFFDEVHGNVIGDHVYISQSGLPHLLGLRIVVRPGRGYYDFLRALDWFLLKTDNTVMDFDRTVSWMKQYLDPERFDWAEVKLVFALRCIGILGWDMLHRGDKGAGDTKKKIEILLRFIRREYY